MQIKNYTVVKKDYKEISPFVTLNYTAFAGYTIQVLQRYVDTDGPELKRAARFLGRWVLFRS